MLDIFQRGSKFTKIKKETANELWKLILEEREELHYKNSNSLSWCGINLFPDKFKECMKKVYEDLGEVNNSYRIIQTKHYEKGAWMDLHKDMREIGDKIAMITLGGDKQYNFYDTENKEYQVLNVSHGDVVILKGECLKNNIEHGFNPLENPCGTIVLRNYRYN